VINMSRKSGIIILALIIVSLCIPVIGIYAWQAKQSQLVEPDVESALSFIISSPTFSFDGVTSSVKILKVTQAMTFAPPAFKIVEAEFDCTYEGYGDRSGSYLTEVVTHHNAILHVTEGKVTIMTIDGVWDEVNQKKL
jgi:hypothetical protein